MPLTVKVSLPCFYYHAMVLPCREKRALYARLYDYYLYESDSHHRHKCATLFLPHEQR